jgi:hypothetical protein
MHFAGVVPEDAPNPADEQWARIARMPFAVYGLVRQPALEEIGPSTSSMGLPGGLSELTVGLSYTLLRNPADRSDPINLAELDDDALRSLDVVPPWPRPPWILEYIERMRYPTLWEAVRTGWYPHPPSRPSLAQALVDHTNHVLHNTFRAERGLEGHVGGVAPAPDVTTKYVQHGVTLRTDGVDRDAVRIDTDPHVFAIGTSIDDATLVTVVVSRDELAYFRLEVAPRASA